MADDVITIPKLRKVISTTYALLPVTGLVDGDLGFATDKLVLYRWNGVAWKAITIAYPILTVAIFQSHAATGTTPNPQRVNDNSLVTQDSNDTIGKYQEIDLGNMYLIQQYREYGTASNNGDGRYKLQYWDGAGWVDWETGIAVRAVASWSSWVAPAGGVVGTSKIRIVSTTIDSSLNNFLLEIEIKY